MHQTDDNKATNEAATSMKPTKISNPTKYKPTKITSQRSERSYLLKKKAASTLLRGVMPTEKKTFPEFIPPNGTIYCSVEYWNDLQLCLPCDHKWSAHYHPTINDRVFSGPHQYMPRVKIVMARSLSDIDVLWNSTN